ncbi:MAG: hypothetical protein WCJ30_15205 [Deltaproteobacteria bacterium]
MTWCPTCTKNFDELEKDVEEPFFDLGHISEFLAANLETLKARFVDQPKRRVVIHEHLGIGATVDSIRKLLGAVPNLEIVELVQDSGFSYACGGQAAKFKDRERAIHRALAEGAVAAGADTIVTMYHSCHRALAGAEAAYPLRVVNFTDVIAEALHGRVLAQVDRARRKLEVERIGVAHVRDAVHRGLAGAERGTGGVGLARDAADRVRRGVLEFWGDRDAGRGHGVSERSHRDVQDGEERATAERGGRDQEKRSQESTHTPSMSRHSERFNSASHHRGSRRDTHGFRARRDRTGSAGARW